MQLNLRTVVLIAFAAATTACAGRVRPTTYFVRVNEWERVTDCILVTSIERGYSTRMSTLGIHVKAPVNGSRVNPSELNRSPTAGGPNPLRVWRAGEVDGKPRVEEEVFFARTIIPDGIVLKAEARALNSTDPLGRPQVKPSKVAPSAKIQGVQQTLQRACMRDFPFYTGTVANQIAWIDAPPGRVDARPTGR